MRADAARNRDRLLSAASEVFAERGLDAPLEEIARRATVSIGTLYNHFPTRESLCDAIFPARMAVLDAAAQSALADPDAWSGFASFTEALFALHAEDRGLNDALAQRVPLSPTLLEACHRCFGYVEQLIDRARSAGSLRHDFAVSDFAALIWAMSQVIRETTAVAPQAWRRTLGFFLDGVRADAAHPVPEPPLTPAQLAAVLTGPRR
ncbi:TetR/AcrR family transcriptional regulator [Paractinoplanes rishiriensis]|uniref:TetR family transcriptional regulator n=1 Tax=Paractinoplanes rishiriensis TaxID=1050105 RepID=A0A919K259_9ACTN|nr:TetR/AcrR family transcriptional regulator [Actinoplanes rishiriensis]GIE97645.1 TetR family transcriptional regulator [Actinoplanes rishiriensis]